MPRPTRIQHFFDHQHIHPYPGEGLPPNLSEALRTHLSAWWQPEWTGNCHAASLDVVRWLAGEGISARVARGGHPDVPGQHSWVVVGRDPWDPHAWVLDPTLHEYRNRRGGDWPLGIWVGTSTVHTPHGGRETIWAVGRPPEARGPIVELTPTIPFSLRAERFLRQLGPLDRRGWMTLAGACPVLGWPAGEVFTAMDDTEGLGALVPIDRLGMTTDRNPGGLYLPAEAPLATTGTARAPSSAL